MDRPVLNTLSLCSGVGMLEIGVSAAIARLGFDSRVVAYCERDAYASSVLLSRMEDSSLDPAPVWCGDLRDFDARPFRGLVDVVTAGLPCQPYSVAGKQTGLSDKRSFGDGEGPIPQFLRIVSECRPALVFCENVPPWIRLGYFRPVGEKLCQLGYKIESPLFVTASSVGASHKRERVFVLAHAASERWRQPVACEARRRPDVEQRNVAVGNTTGERTADDSESSRPRNSTGESSGQLADAERPRRTSRIRPAQHARRESSSGSESVGDARLQHGELQQRPAGSEHSRASEQLADTPEQRLPKRSSERINRNEKLTSFARSSSIFAPGPIARWQSIPQHLWPAIESRFRLLADGDSVVLDASRTDQLRCGGNGVVPLAAAIAFVELVQRILK